MGEHPQAQCFQDINQRYQNRWDNISTHSRLFISNFHFSYVMHVHAMIDVMLIRGQGTHPRPFFTTGIAQNVVCNLVSLALIPKALYHEWIPRSLPWLLSVVGSANLRSISASMSKFRISSMYTMQIYVQVYCAYWFDDVLIAFRNIHMIWWYWFTIRIPIVISCRRESGSFHLLFPYHTRCWASSCCTQLHQGVMTNL